MNHDLTDLLSALGEPTRLAAMRLFWDGEEHCVCELTPVLGVSQSRMSRHMSRLKQAGLVVDRRDRQWVRYSLNPNMPAEIRAIVAAVVTAAKTQNERIPA